MRHASSTLITLLNTSTELLVADVLTIVPRTGASLYLTSAPLDITVVSQLDSLAHTFKSGGVDPTGVARPMFERAGAKWVIGTQVDSLALTVKTNVLALLNGEPWTQQAREGFFDGARIWLEQVYTATWGDWSAGTLIVFAGRAGQLQPTRNTIAMSVVSDLALLQQASPRNVYQAGCLHNLYDTGCAILKSSFTDSGTCTSGCTTTAIFATGMPHSTANYYSQGQLTFTSGANIGLTRTVQSYGSSAFGVSPPFPAAPAAGDTFTATAGCDKAIADGSGDVTLGTCQARFANLTHARGYPFIPSPESGS